MRSFVYVCTYIYIYVYVGEGDGTPLQYSCLENPMDGGARWAAVHGVAKSQTRLTCWTTTSCHHRLLSVSLFLSSCLRGGNFCFLKTPDRFPWRGQWHLTPVLLPGKSHGRRSVVGCSPWGRKSRTTERLHFHFLLSCIGEGNGNPLQCSCLENPRDRGAWWAAVYGVTQSRTQLKWLSSSSSRFPVLSYIPHENHRVSIKGMHSEVGQTSVPNLTVPLNHVTLSLLLFLSKPQFPHLLNWNKSNS